MPRRPRGLRNHVSSLRQQGHWRSRDASRIETDKYETKIHRKPGGLLRKQSTIPATTSPNVPSAQRFPKTFVVCASGETSALEPMTSQFEQHYFPREKYLR